MRSSFNTHHAIRSFVIGCTLPIFSAGLFACGPAIDEHSPVGEQTPTSSESPVLPTAEMVPPASENEPIQPSPDMLQPEGAL